MTELNYAMNCLAKEEQPKLIPVFFIQWHLLNRCNLRCNHCYQDRHFDEKVDFNKYRNLVRQIATDFLPLYGKIEFNLTGGEPLLYEDLWRLAGVIRSVGAQWNLLTNGTLIDRQIAAALKRNDVQGVQVSLEGMETENDRVRGPGSYQKVLETIYLLKAEKIRTNIAVTLTSNNIGMIDDFLHLSSHLGVDLGFHRYIPMGKLVNANPSLQPSAAVWNSAIEKIAHARLDNHLRVTMNDPLFSLKLFELKNGRLDKKSMGQRLWGCTIGVGGVTIMPDGAIYPCRKLPVPLGNVFKKPLLRIWMDSKQLWAFRNRDQYQGKCGKCAANHLCGGCRASAYWHSHHGNPLAEDVFCEKIHFESLD